MRLLNSIGLFLVFIFFIVCGSLTQEVGRVGRNNFLSNNYNSRTSVDEFTIFAAKISLIFLSLFTLIYLLNLVKVKTKTSKKIKTIGLSLTFTFLLLSGAMFFLPAKLSFNNTGPAFSVYCLICLAFFITHLVQSVRYTRRVEASLPPEDLTQGIKFNS